MSQKIRLKFECVACTNKTPITTVKPTFGKNNISSHGCENCDSVSLLKITKQPGNPNGVLYNVIECEFTKIGAEIYKKREAELHEKFAKLKEEQAKIAESSTEPKQLELTDGQTSQPQKERESENVNTTN